jgi:hypothetical protein
MKVWLGFLMNKNAVSGVVNMEGGIQYDGQQSDV